MDQINVLNHGFVRLVDMMGNDSSIVQAARVSYGQGTKTISEDENLIRYLLRNKHTTPFEMVEFKFHVKLPIFVARQWIRHRTFSFNEVSGRYSEMKDEFFLPEDITITTQSTSNKQGGSQELVKDAYLHKLRFEQEQSDIYSCYKFYLNSGMRKELARIDLPLSLYTEWYCKVDLHNLFHFLRLRLDSHAQYEIRVYGEAIATLIKDKVPMAWRAFEDYVLNSMTFSAKELELITRFLTNPMQTATFSNEYLIEFFQNKREAEEFTNKLSKLRGRI